MALFLLYVRPRIRFRWSRGEDEKRANLRRAILSAKASGAFGRRLGAFRTSGGGDGNSRGARRRSIPGHLLRALRIRSSLGLRRLSGARGPDESRQRFQRRSAPPRLSPLGLLREPPGGVSALPR